LKCIASVVMQPCAIGQKRDCRLEVLEGLIETLEPFEGDPTIVVCFAVVGGFRVIAFP
jgi:hypothetical protein